MPTTDIAFSFHGRLNPALDEDFDHDALWDDFLADMPHVDDEPGHGTLVWADKTVIAHGAVA